MEKIFIYQVETVVMSEQISSIIKKYREKRIIGNCIDFVPFLFTDAENVVEIYNREKANIFLLNI